MASQDPEEAAVAEFLAILEEHREDCEKNSLYIEADIAKKRLEELWAHEETRRREAIRSRHIAERLDIEEAHMREYEEFCQRWDQKMHEYDQRSQVMELSLKEKHEQELADWLQKSQNSFLVRPKFSKELLNLRSIEENLARRKDYREAQAVKEKADVMEKWELEELKNSYRKQLEKKKSKFYVKQDTELKAFHQRIAAGREKQKRIRKERLQRILKRYQNIKADLERQQNLERIKTVKYAEMGISTAPSFRRRPRKTRTAQDKSVYRSTAARNKYTNNNNNNGSSNTNTRLNMNRSMGSSFNRQHNSINDNMYNNNNNNNHNNNNGNTDHGGNHSNKSKFTKPNPPYAHTQHTDNKNPKASTSKQRTYNNTNTNISNSSSNSGNFKGSQTARHGRRAAGSTYGSSSGMKAPLTARDRVLMRKKNKGRRR